MCKCNDDKTRIHCSNCISLKLEVGKKYHQYANQKPWKILSIGKEKIFIRLDDGTELLHSLDNLSGWKEYKEPVTHQKDIIWFLVGTSNGVDRLETIVREVGYCLSPYSKEVHRQTVSYTEER